MKVFERKASAVIILLFLVPTVTTAQFYKDMSIGLNVGAYIYQGDLTPERLGSFKTISPGISLFAKKPINHFLSARLHMSFAKLKGDESKYSNPDWRQQRNFMFTTPLKEFSAQLVWNVLGRNYDDRGIMPYVFSGAGISFVKITKDYSRLNTAYFGEGSTVTDGLALDNAAGVPRRLISIPIGAGAEYPLSERFSVNIETAYRFIFSDYLDGFSQSANPKRQDHYHSTSAGLIYKFGKINNGIGCPVMKF